MELLPPDSVRFEVYSLRGPWGGQVSEGISVQRCSVSDYEVPRGIGRGRALLVSLYGAEVWDVNGSYGNTHNKDRRTMLFDGKGDFLMFRARVNVHSQGSNI